MYIQRISIVHAVNDDLIVRRITLIEQDCFDL